MTTYVHSAACLAEQAALVAWFERWPNACASCLGEGGHRWGGSYYEPPEWEPCHDCVEALRCGRCGSEPVGYDEETGYSRCPACYWTDDPDTQRLHWTELVGPYDDGCMCAFDPDLNPEAAASNMQEV